MKTKKLLAILITMGMITGMTACGQNNSNSTDENAKSEDTTENSSTDSTENQETTESTDSARGDFSDVSITHH